MLNRSEASPREAHVHERGICVVKIGFAGGSFASLKMTGVEAEVRLFDTVSATAISKPGAANGNRPTIFD